MSRRYIFMLVVCMASGWPSSVFSAEASAEAAAPVEAAAAPVDAAAAPVESATAPSDVVDTPPAESEPTEEQEPPVQFAPVRVQFGGNIGYVMQRQKTGSSKYSTQSLNTNVNINAESFIWEPWLAQVKGGLGLNANRSTSSTGSGFGTTTDSKTSGNFVTGNAALLLLQSSRFPFETHYTRSDSRQTSGLAPVSSDYQTTRYGLSQRYRTLAGDSNYMVSYDRNLWEGADLSKDTQDEWHVETSHQFVKQSLSLGGASTRNVRSLTNESNRVKALTASHNYRPDGSLSVDTLASLVHTNHQQTMSENGVKFAQLSSSSSWRSDEKPLRVNGSLRVHGLTNFTSDIGSPVAETRTRSANANLGAAYDLSSQTRLDGSASVTKNYDNNGMQTVITNENIGISSVPDLIEFGVYSYSRSISSSLSNQNGGQLGSAQHFTLSPGHGVNRDMELNGGVLGMKLNQSLALDMDNRNPSTTRRIHAGSLGWSLIENQKTTTLRMTVSDSHTMGGTQDYYQLINLQASISENLSRNTSWRGNLTAQKARNGGNTITNTISNTASADLSYNHSQAFGIPRLNFVSELRMDGSSFVPPPLGVADPQESISWENRLEHSIGLLQTRLSLRVAEVNHTSQSMLWFSLNRQF